MDEENVLFLDWLSNQGKPFPTSRSWWNNECISLIRMLFRNGQIGVPIASMQGIPGILLGIPRIPQIPAPNEPSLSPSPNMPHQTRFSFFSHLHGHVLGLGVAGYRPPSFPASLRRTFALRIPAWR
jgi:hypothetical protein